MLDLQTIKDETLWVIKHNGWRETCKGSELSKKLDLDNDVRDYGVVTWEKQPKELQEFWKSYHNAYYIFDRRDLKIIDDVDDIDDFYTIWVKDPHQFDVEHRPVISTLRKKIADLDPKDDLLIINYDRSVIGNHHVINFIRALDRLDTDFDVVSIGSSNDQLEIIIQSDDRQLIRDFNIRSNDEAIREAFGE